MSLTTPLPLPPLSALAAPVTEADLRAYLGDARYEAWQPQLRAACRLADGSGYYFDLTTYTLRLPADRDAVGRALLGALREASR